MKLLQVYRRKYTINTYVDLKGSIYIYTSLRGVQFLSKSILDYNYYHNLMEKKELYAVTKKIPKQSYP